MSKVETLINVLRDKRHGRIKTAVFYNLINLGLFSFLSDRKFLQLAYKVLMEEPLDLQNPKTFNEKLQWLKLYDRKREYTSMVDKLRAKDYVSNILGSEYIIPTLAVWDNPETIELEGLPEKFVIKTNNGSGGNDVIVCKDKSALNLKDVRHSMQRSLKTNTYRTLREWPYKDIEPKIFAEEYVVDNGKELHDYKFFCFHGTVVCFKVDFNRWEGHRANYYSPDLQLIPYGEVICPPDFSQTPPIPENIGEMIIIAEKLSYGHPFMRVDLYNVNGKIYFGEMTFYPASGLSPFTDKKFDLLLGKLLKVPFETHE